MMLYTCLWWVNIATTVSLAMVLYVGGINADRPAKKVVMSLMALACVLEFIFSIYSYHRAGTWVEQAMFVAITGQVQRFCLKIPMVCYVILTSRSVKSWLGLCRYKRKIHLYPRANPELALPSMGTFVKSFQTDKETVPS